MSPWQVLRAKGVSRAALDRRVGRVGTGGASGYNVTGGYRGYNGPCVSSAYGGPACARSFSETSGEKVTMQQLNERLASYMDQVQSLEAANEKLEQQIKEHLDRKSPCDLRELDEPLQTVDLLQAKISESQAAQAQIKVQLVGANLKVFDLSAKCDREREHRELIEADLRDLRLIEEELKTFRIPDLRNQLSSHTLHLEDLHQLHQEDVQDLLAQVSRGVAVEIQCAESSGLSQQLECLRSRCTALVLKNLTQNEHWFNTQVSTLSSQESPSPPGSGSEVNQTELKELKRTSLSLKGDLTKLQAQKAMLEKGVVDLREGYNVQLAGLQRRADGVGEELDLVLQATEQRAADYQALLDIKTRLETEIDDYRRLLDGQGDWVSSSSSNSIASVTLLCAEINTTALQSKALLGHNDSVSIEREKQGVRAEGGREHSSPIDQTVNTSEQIKQTQTTVRSNQVTQEVHSKQTESSLLMSTDDRTESGSSSTSTESQKQHEGRENTISADVGALLGNAKIQPLTVSTTIENQSSSIGNWANSVEADVNTVPVGAQMSQVVDKEAMIQATAPASVSVVTEVKGKEMERPTETKCVTHLIDQAGSMGSTGSAGPLDAETDPKETTQQGQGQIQNGTQVNSMKSPETERSNDVCMSTKEGSEIEKKADITAQAQSILQNETQGFPSSDIHVKNDADTTEQVKCRGGDVHVSTVVTDSSPQTESTPHDEQFSVSTERQRLSDNHGVHPSTVGHTEVKAVKDTEGERGQFSIVQSETKLSAVEQNLSTEGKVGLTSEATLVDREMGKEKKEIGEVEEEERESVTGGGVHIVSVTDIEETLKITEYGVHVTPGTTKYRQVVDSIKVASTELDSQIDNYATDADVFSPADPELCLSPTEPELCMSPVDRRVFLSPMDTEECLSPVKVEKAMLEKGVVDLREGYNVQLAGLQRRADSVGEELNLVLQATEQRAADYQALLDIKTRLETEIDDYRRLLDGQGDWVSSSSSNSIAGVTPLCAEINTTALQSKALLGHNDSVSIEREKQGVRAEGGREHSSPIDQTVNTSEQIKQTQTTVRSNQVTQEVHSKQTESSLLMSTDDRTESGSSSTSTESQKQHEGRENTISADVGALLGNAKIQPLTVSTTIENQSSSIGNRANSVEADVNTVPVGAQMSQVVDKEAMIQATAPASVSVITEVKGKEMERPTETKCVTHLIDQAGSMGSTGSAGPLDAETDPKETTQQGQGQIQNGTQVNSMKSPETERSNDVCMSTKESSEIEKKADITAQAQSILQNETQGFPSSDIHVKNDANTTEQVKCRGGDVHVSTVVTDSSHQTESTRHDEQFSVSTERQRLSDNHGVHPSTVGHTEVNTVKDTEGERGQFSIVQSETKLSAVEQNLFTEGKVGLTSEVTLVDREMGKEKKEIGEVEEEERESVTGGGIHIVSVTDIEETLKITEYGVHVTPGTTKYRQVVDGIKVASTELDSQIDNYATDADVFSPADPELCLSPTEPELCMSPVDRGVFLSPMDTEECLSPVEVEVFWSPIDPEMCVSLDDQKACMSLSEEDEVSMNLTEAVSSANPVERYILATKEEYQSVAFSGGQRLTEDDQTKERVMSPEGDRDDVKGHTTKDVRLSSTDSGCGLTLTSPKSSISQRVGDQEKVMSPGGGYSRSNMGVREEAFSPEGRYRNRSVGEREEVFSPGSRYRKTSAGEEGISLGDLYKRGEEERQEPLSPVGRYRKTSTGYREDNVSPLGRYRKTSTGDRGEPSSPFGRYRKTSIGDRQEVASGRYRRLSVGDREETTINSMGTGVWGISGRVSDNAVASTGGRVVDTGGSGGAMATTAGDSGNTATSFGGMANNAVATISFDGVGTNSVANGGGVSGNREASNGGITSASGASAKGMASNVAASSGGMASSAGTSVCTGSLASNTQTSLSNIVKTAGDSSGGMLGAATANNGGIAGGLSNAGSTVSGAVSGNTATSAGSGECGSTGGISSSSRGLPSAGSGVRGLTGTAAGRRAPSPAGAGRLGGGGSGEWKVYTGSTGRISSAESGGRLNSAGSGGRLSTSISSGIRLSSSPGTQRVTSPPGSTRLDSAGSGGRLSTSISSGIRLSSSPGTQRVTSPPGSIRLVSAGSGEWKPVYSATSGRMSSAGSGGRPSGSSSIPNRALSPGTSGRSGASAGSGGRLSGGSGGRISGAVSGTRISSAGSGGCSPSGTGKINSTGGRVISSSDGPMRSTGSGAGGRKERISVCKMAALLISAAGREKSSDKQKQPVRSQQQKAADTSPRVQRWVTGVGDTATADPADLADIMRL